MLSRSFTSKWKPFESLHCVDFANWQRSCSHIWTDVDKNRSGDLPFVFEDGFGWAQIWTWYFYLFLFEVLLGKLIHCFKTLDSNIFIRQFEWADFVLSATITLCPISYSRATVLQVWEVCRICTRCAHVLRVSKQSVHWLFWAII